MSDAEDRTIPATPRRRLMARREGMIPPAALPAWGASVAVTILLFPAWWRATATAGSACVRAACTRGVTFDGWSVAPVVLPTLALVVAAAAAALGVRSLVDGAGFSPARALPDPRRIGLLSGLRRILSGATLSTALTGILWLALPAAVAARAAARLFDLSTHALQTLPRDASGATLVAHAAAVIPASFALLLPTLVATVAVAIVRWGWLRRGAERRLRMTPEELREELRDQGSAGARRQGRAADGAAAASAAVGQVVAGGA